MPTPDGPADLFGIGKMIGIAASVLFALRLGQGTRNWWARRKRDRELQAMRQKQKASDPPARPNGSSR